MKTVALIGGSFNPPHDGHFEMGRYIHEKLKPDEIWMMFSVNRTKDPSKYESVASRMAMGELMKVHYPDVPFVMSDCEEQAGTHETYCVLQYLRAEYPNCRFIWVMGADNLATFETWDHADDFFLEFSIAVLDRPSYTDAALASPMAKKFSTLRRNTPEEFMRDGNGWIFFDDNPKLDLSSTILLERLSCGETEFEGGFRDVAAYIRERGLYGMQPDLAIALALQRHFTPG